MHIARKASGLESVLATWLDFRRQSSGLKAFDLSSGAQWEWSELKRFSVEDGRHGSSLKAWESKEEWFNIL